MITIHFEENKNLYEQIYTYFRDEIKNGNLKWKDKLPSRRSLAQHLGVSLNTVKTAYDQLTEEGYIVSDQRRGFFVDKLYAERLKMPEPEIVFEERTATEYEYNFSHSLIDVDKLPISILKKCSNEAIENSLKNFSSPKGGIWTLRIEIAKYLKEHRGVSISPENIIITGGYGEHIFILMSLIDKPVFAVEDPGYNKTMDLINGLSEKINRIPLDKYGFSVADLEKTNANIAIVTPNHQFPTGTIMVLRRRQRLLEWADKNCRYIVEDDYDSDFKYAGKPIPALKSLDKDDKVILSGSFSKIVGKFLGVSYLVLPQKLKEKYDKIQIPTSGASIIQQNILERFMATGAFEKHINRMNAHYRKKRSVIIKELKREGIEILGADAGTYFVMRVDEKIWDLKNLKEKLSKNSIKLNTVADYSSQGKYERDLIIGFGGLKEEKLKETIRNLLEIISY